MYIGIYLLFLNTLLAALKFLLGLICSTRHVCTYLFIYIYISRLSKRYLFDYNYVCILLAHIDYIKIFQVLSIRVTY